MLTALMSVLHIFVAENELCILIQHIFSLLNICDRSHVAPSSCVQCISAVTHSQWCNIDWDNSNH